MICFLNMCPIFVGCVDNFGESKEKKIISVFDQWSKLDVLWFGCAFRKSNIESYLMSNEGVRGGNVMKNESDINYVKAAKISIRFSSNLQRVKAFFDDAIC